MIHASLHSFCPQSLGPACQLSLRRRQSPVTGKRPRTYRIVVAESAQGSDGNKFDFFGFLKPKPANNGTAEAPKKTDSKKLSSSKPEDLVKSATESAGKESSAGTAKSVGPPTPAEAAAVSKAPTPAAKPTGSPEEQAWELGNDENEWGVLDKPKADPLGYFIMLVLFSGLIVFTTAIFRYAGNWRAARQSPRPLQTSQQADSAQDNPTKPQEGQQAAFSTSQLALQPYSEGNLPESTGEGDHEFRIESLTSSRDSRTAASPEAPAQDVHDKVFIAGEGWVDASKADLQGFEAENGGQGAPDDSVTATDRASDSGQRDGSERTDGTRHTESESLGVPEAVTFEASKASDEARSTLLAESRQGKDETVGALPPRAQFELTETSHPLLEELSAASPEQEAYLSTDAVHLDEEAPPKQKPILERREFDRGQQSEPSEAPRTRTHDSEAASQAQLEFEDGIKAKGESFWGPEIPRESRSLPLPQVDPVKQSTGSQQQDLEKWNDASLSSLRARAMVAMRASLAANEASQRAAAYSSSASTAASKAALYAERAATASSIAQQAASHRSERVLSEAVARAEKANEDAAAAEKRVAEAAAHAVAHEEAGGSQSELAQQAAEHPNQPEESRSAGEVKGFASKARKQAADTWFVVWSWAQQQGHRLMAWLSVGISWLREVWGRLTALAVRVWEQAKTPFVKKAS